MTTAADDFPLGTERSIFDTQNLTEEQFRRWWEMLDQEDRDEFKWLYNGDQLLARFICALDLLVVARVQGGDHKALIQMAYYIAAKPFPSYAVSLADGSLRIYATRAYNHPAVQTIIERTRLRNRLQERTRIETLMLEGVEQMLKDAIKRNENDEPIYDMKDRKFAMDAALRVVEITDNEQARQRGERTRKGMERARQAALEGDVESPQVLQATIKALVAKIGKEEVEKIMADDGV